ncbi:MAG TPA: ABC transporter permease [Vicinamibacterales bacterium]
MDDFRFALRQLRKSSGFTLTAIGTLALGFAASLAIFAFVDAAFLQPLPFRDSVRLTGVYETVPLFPRSNLSYMDYQDWKRLNTVFSSLAAYQGSGATLTTAAGAERVPAARVSADLFRTLGVAPAVGRDFRDGEDRPGAAGTVLLSYGVWQSRFGGRDSVLGTSVTLNGNPFVVIGVLPREFSFSPAGPADFWLPLQPAAAGCDARRSCHNLYGVARLADGVTLPAAAANVKAVAAALEQQYPDSNRGQGSAVVELTEVIIGPVRPILGALAGGAALLLIIAAVNVAGLLIVRADGRRREIAVRSALGASRARIVRQLVVEGTVLVAASAAAGLAAADAGIRLLLSLVPPDMLGRMPFLRTAGLTGHTWIAASAIAAGAIALFAATPLLRLSPGRASAAALGEASRGSAGRTWSRAGRTMVIVELALATVLLTGGVLLTRSLLGLLRVDLGMDTSHVAMLEVYMPRRYNSDAQLIAAHQRVIERVQALPGVEAVGTTSVRPLQGGNTNWIRIDGRPYHGEHNEVNAREVDPGYFPTIRAQLARGRGFSAHDTADAPRVTIVNQAFVRTYFPGGADPIGQKLFYAPTTTTPPLEIVGVIDDIKENPLDAVTPPTMYTAYAQDVDSAFWLFVRSAQPEDAMVTELTAAVHALDPDLATSGGGQLSHLVDGSVPAYMRRSGAWLVGSFAACAWLLGVVGLYGVVAYSVGRRTREIGVRMALGAQRHSVAGMIVRDAGRVIAVGLVAGTIGAAGAARLAQTLLFGVRAWDPATLSGVALVLGTSALLASYVPARRAASVNPIEALRVE